MFCLNHDVIIHDVAGRSLKPSISSVDLHNTCADRRWQHDADILSSLIARNRLGLKDFAVFLKIIFVLYLACGCRRIHASRT